MSTQPIPTSPMASLVVTDREPISRATVLKVFAAIAVVTFLLRIFYAGHLYQDDGLWFTAAEEILRGKALYREIYFDKPPAIALLYALLFKAFGAHIIVIRLFTIVYSLAVSAVLYAFGSRLYGKRAGLLAAGMFAIFSTTYTTGHMQGLNTDFLMALPYSAAAYFFIRSRINSPKGSRAWFAVAGGAMAGIAFQVNPKALFDMIFFAAMLIVFRRRFVDSSDEMSWTEAGRLFLIAILGFITGSLLFLGPVAATHSLSAYWLYVWDWGSRYSIYYPIWKSGLSALTQSANYFALNITLLIGLAFVAAITVKRVFRSDTKSAIGADSGALAAFQADVALLMWFAASYAGLSIGGRFYGHYFFQILSALCLIGARGLMGIIAALKAQDYRNRKLNTRRISLALLVTGFVFTVVRFHGRTAALAVDWARGEKSGITSRWFHDRLNHEERMAAAVVRQLPDGADAANLLGRGAMREDSPRLRGADGQEDHLFIWGYRPEIYYWSGLLPASRYLSSQPLTGVPADVHYFGDSYEVVLDESRTAPERAQLLRDLEQTRPKYIIDELGFFNSDLSIHRYPELREFMKAYKNIGATGRVIVYKEKNKSRKKRLRKEATEQ